MQKLTKSFKVYIDLNKEPLTRRERQQAIIEAELDGYVTMVKDQCVYRRKVNKLQVSSA